MTSSNPIFVEDEPQPPAKSRPKRTMLSDVDVSSLPPPSNEDIVSTLIKERDIFPLLENILKFIAVTPPRASSETPSAESRSQTPNGELRAAKKRRKLRDVPAGAALWDVPFPFDEGEGPKTYRSDWEKDRGKRLIAELVNLIKGAAKKAALQNHEEKRKTPTEAQLASLSKYYRVDTLFYGNSSTPKSSETEVLADASNGRRPSVAPYFNSSPPPPSPPVPSSSSVPSDPSSGPSDSSFNSAPFDQLITSLLSVSSTEQLSSNASSGSFNNFFDSSAPLDTGLFNSWMDILQAFPMPAEGFTPDFKTEDLHIDPRQTFLTVSNSIPQDTPSPAMSSSFDFSSDFTQAFPEAFTASANQDFYPAPLDDLMTDPALMGLPASSTHPSSIDPSSMSNFSDSGCPSLIGSPIPSVSSYSFGGPMTPTESGWNGDASIGIFSPGEGERVDTPGVEPQPDVPSQVAGTSNGKKRDFGEMAGWTNAEKEALSFLEVLSKSKSELKGKGKARAEEDREDGGAAGKDTAEDDKFSKLRTLPIVGSLARADVLNSAKQRREQLAAQITKTRVALWETTIEGGVLAGLVKHYSTG
ncbi:hypothetical protein MVEN_02493700 [Mycena venus]|uniref:Uncharacterized protein n=1 Tax=Mycena venus TaxID=2733690 RepID=A0A8H6WXM6_9AGAR|nr:hypothetical protein MVEN_02493700 [Mycena venus]